MSLFFCFFFFKYIWKIYKIFKENLRVLKPYSLASLCRLYVVFSSFSPSHNLPLLLGETIQGLTFILCLFAAVGITTPSLMLLLALEKPSTHVSSILQMWKELENASESENEYGTWSHDRMGSQNQCRDNNDSSREQSSDLGKVERERVRQIVRGWMESGWIVKLLGWSNPTRPTSDFTSIFFKWPITLTTRIVRLGPLQCP